MSNKSNNKNVIPKAGQVWEDKCGMVDVESYIDSHIGFTRIGGNSFYRVATERFLDRFKFVPQTDLEWLALRIEKWNYPDHKSVVKSSDGLCQYESDGHGYAPEQIQQCRDELFGAELKEGDTIEICPREFPPGPNPQLWDVVPAGDKINKGEQIMDHGDLKLKKHEGTPYTLGMMSDVADEIKKQTKNLSIKTEQALKTDDAFQIEYPELNISGVKIVINDNLESLKDLSVNVCGEKPVYTQAMDSDGELPPIGCKCLIVKILCGAVSGLVNGQEVEIIHHGKAKSGQDYAAFKWQNPGDDFISFDYSIAKSFGPIDNKKDEEKAIDDLVAAMDGVSFSLNQTCSDGILDAIKAGEIHSVKWVG